MSVMGSPYMRWVQSFEVQLESTHTAAQIPACRRLAQHKAKVGKLRHFTKGMMTATTVRAGHQPRYVQHVDPTIPTYSCFFPALRIRKLFTLQTPKPLQLLAPHTSDPFPPLPIPDPQQCRQQAVMQQHTAHRG